MDTEGLEVTLFMIGSIVIYSCTDTFEWYFC